MYMLVELSMHFHNGYLSLKNKMWASLVCEVEGRIYKVGILSRLFYVYSLRCHLSYVIAFPQSLCELLISKLHAYVH